MTNIELKLYAHAEAEKLLKLRYGPVEALKFGLRRAHNKRMHERMQASYVEQPKFMWLRGM